MRNRYREENAGIEIDRKCWNRKRPTTRLGRQKEVKIGIRKKHLLRFKAIAIVAAERDADS